jgi:hypothetical protein
MSDKKPDYEVKYGDINWDFDVNAYYEVYSRNQFKEEYESNFKFREDPYVQLLEENIRSLQLEVMELKKDREKTVLEHLYDVAQEQGLKS